MRDALFGEIEYETLSWWGKCSWPVFGREVTTPLSISCYESEVIADYQRAAFIAFEGRKEDFGALAEEAILQYYLGLSPEHRERFSEAADRLAPVVTRRDEVGRLVTPEQIIVQESIGGARERIIGLLFTCSWDIELGLAVKFVNERLCAVGTQDIVL